MIYSAIQYGTVVVLGALPIFATALGQARVGKAALAALKQQPAHDSGIKKLFFAAIALSETVALIAVLMVAYLFKQEVLSDLAGYVRICAVGAIVVPAVLTGYRASRASAQALISVARQPALTSRVLNFMLITQSLMQTPVIFCTLFAAIIQAQAATVTTAPEAMRLCAAAIVLALCAAGPCIGLSTFIARATQALKYNREAYSSLFSFTFMSQAIIETPFLLGLAVALVLLQVEATTVIKGVAYLCAAVTLGVSAIVVSISSAHVATQVVDGIAHRPHETPLLGRFSLFCQAFIDTTAIYGLIVALLFIIL